MYMINSYINVIYMNVKSKVTNIMLSVE